MATEQMYHLDECIMRCQANNLTLEIRFEGESFVAFVYNESGEQIDQAKSRATHDEIVKVLGAMSSRLYRRFADTL